MTISCFPDLNGISPRLHNHTEVSLHCFKNVLTAPIPLPPQRKQIIGIPGGSTTSLPERAGLCSCLCLCSRPSPLAPRPSPLAPRHAPLATHHALPLATCHLPFASRSRSCSSSCSCSCSCSCSRSCSRSRSCSSSRSSSRSCASSRSCSILLFSAVLEMKEKLQSNVCLELLLFRFFYFQYWYELTGSENTP